MFKSYSSFSMLLILSGLLISNVVLAQTPPYATTNVNSTGSNAFPFNTTSNKKTQFLYRPGDLGTVPGGLIDTIWFRNNNTASGSSAGPGTYSNFQLRMGQFTSNVFPGAGSLDFYSPSQLTSVINEPSYTINQTAPSGAWYYIPLPIPFPYDPSQTLVVDVEMDNRTSGSGFQSATFNVGAAPNHQRLTSTANGATSGNASAILSDFGVSIAPLLGLDAAAQALISPTAPLAGGQVVQVSMNVQNRGSNNLVSATVGYQLDNNPPVTETWSGNLGGFITALHTFATPLTIPSTNTYTLKIWVTNANGLGPDLNNSNDTLTVQLCNAFPAGVYSVGGPTADFIDITAAVDAITCGGIAGPVTFNINPGTYYGTYQIPNLPGASPSSTITFSSVTGLASDVILIPDTTTGASNGSHFVVNHTARVSFQNLTFRRVVALASAGQACLVFGNNSEGDAIGNAFEDQTASSSSFNVGILYGGASALILNNSFSGFYYAVHLNGTAANPFPAFNQVLANSFNNYIYRAIYALNQNNAVISNNSIREFVGTSTAGAGIWAANTYALQISENLMEGAMSAYGVLLSNLNADTTAPQANTNRIYNNVINGRQASTINSTALVLNPIHITGSTSTTANPPNPRDAVEIVHNTVYWELNSTSTSTIQAGLYVTGGSATAPAFAYINVQNNHFEVNPLPGVNLPSAFRLVRFTLAQQLDSLSSTNNNYRMGGSTPPALFRVNSPANDYATLSAWQTATSKDANSLTVDPAFISTVNNLLPTSVGLDNAGIAVPFVQTDIFGVGRSATTPDIGAYEFVGRVFSQINVNVLSDTLLGPSRSLTANITDSVSTIVAGSARLFYKKTSQFQWQLDTLPSIAGNNYTFLIDYAALGGVAMMDTIEYYVAVNNALNTITTAPLGGDGLYLNNAIAPGSRHSYMILPVVNGNYRVGVSGPADFPTLTAAANFLSSGLVTGPVSFILIDSLYSSAENFPINIGTINGSSRANHVRFVADTSRTSILIEGGALPAIVVINGSSNLEWNGSASNGQNAIEIRNNSAAANTAVIYATSSTGSPVDSVIIRNMKLVAGSNSTTSSFGIHLGGGAISTTGTAEGASRVYLLNNEISNAYYGIYTRGSINNPINTLRISSNIIGNADPVQSVNLKGIDAQNAIDALINHNEIFNIVGSTSAVRSGIEIGGTGSNNFRITANRISNVATAATNAANGIYVISGNGFVIDNNVIHGVRSQNGSSTSQTTNASGIRLSSGTGHKVFYNSVHLYGAYTNASTVGAASAALNITSTVVNNLEVKNNVFSNTMSSTSTGDKFFVAVWGVTNFSPGAVDMNNNAYHVPDSAHSYVGRVGTTVTPTLYTDVAAWKGFTSSGSNASNDLLSVPPTGRSVAPFIADTNLNIAAGTMTGIESGAVAIASLGLPNTDITGQTRPGGSGLGPDMGAYEFNGVLLPDAFPPTIDSAEISPLESQCSVTPRTVTAYVRDNAGGVGIDSVFISYTIATVQQPLILMTRTAGTPASGTYSGTVPAAAGPNLRHEISVVARDSNGNFAPVRTIGVFADDYLAVNAGNDTTITAGDTARLRAAVVGFAGTTVVAADRNGGNGSAGASFNLKANTTIVLDSIYVPIYGTIGAAATVDIWHSTTPINGTPNIATTAGWTRIVTAGPTVCLNSGITGGAAVSAIAIPNNLTIPAGSTHAFFAQVMSGGSQVYTTHTAALVDTFTDGTIVIYTGPNVGYGGNAPNPVNHPRMFNGSVGYKSSAGVRWTELGSSVVLASTDTFRTAPLTTTTYVVTLTDSICTKTDTVTVFVNPNITDDIGVSAILTPTAATVGQPSTVKVVIENFGTTPATGFDVAFAINGTELNANAIARTVPAGDTIHHIFTQSWTPTAGGNTNVCAYTKGLATDVNAANDTSCASVPVSVGGSVNEVNNLLSKVYPVPADQFVTFDFGQHTGTGKLELRDALGRVVYSSSIDLTSSTSHEVKTSALAAGVYNYQFVLNEKVQYGQVVVRR